MELKFVLQKLHVRYFMYHTLMLKHYMTLNLKTTTGRSDIVGIWLWKKKKKMKPFARQTHNYAIT